MTPPLLRAVPPALCTAILVLAAGSSPAIPTSLTSADSPQCDVLSVPSVVEELGTNPGSPTDFPADSVIGAVRLADTTTSACAAQDDSQLPNLVLEITNLSGRDYAAVWYTVDRGSSASTVSNFDGLLNGGSQAFRIDATGSNTPLLSESVSADGIFEDGEAWTFVVQDFENVISLPSESLGSQGLDSSTKNSTGSILAVPVPEPGTIPLLLLALGGLAVLRRSGWAPAARARGEKWA